MKKFDNKRKYKVYFLIRYFLLLSIILFSFINITYAHDAMSLKDAIKFGFENNNELKAFKYSVSSKNRDIASERSTLLPIIAMEEAFTSTNNPVNRLNL